MKNSNVKHKQQVKRDYNKEPIVIKDNNAIFGFMFIIPVIIAMILIYIYNPGGVSEKSLSTNLFFCLPMVALPYILPYLRSRNKRKIILTNNTIKFMHENLVIEQINLDKEFQIFKTYEPYYHKSQKPNEIVIKISYCIYYPFIIIFNFIYYVSAKLLYNLFTNGLKKYKFYDSIIIFQDNKVINILPTSDEEYKEIRKYFINVAKINIYSAKVFLNKFSCLYEKINYEKLENEQK